MKRLESPQKLYLGEIKRALGRARRPQEERRLNTREALPLRLGARSTSSTRRAEATMQHGLDDDISLLLRLQFGQNHLQLLDSCIIKSQATGLFLKANMTFSNDRRA